MDKGGRLRRLLETRWPDTDIEDDDINKLVARGYATEHVLAVASRDELLVVLPGREGIVTGLIAAFRKPQRPAVRVMCDGLLDASFHARLIERIPEVSELKGYLLQPPRKAFPVTLRRYLQSSLSRLLADLFEPLRAEDESIKWIKLMSVIKPALPRNKADVTRVLFPDVQRKLPVTRETYHRLIGVFHAREYLEEADGSQLPAVVSNGLLWKFSDLGLSEMATTLFVGFQLNQFFSLFQEVSVHSLKYTLLFNCNEKAGDSYSDVTVEKSRPDTLCVASGRTLLVGGDKVKNLPAAEEDLRKKVKMLPPIYYGELEFILGYVAAGSDFQWVYVGKNGGRDLSLISPCLRLTLFQDRCKFFLSLGYAYHLLCSMVDAVPEVQSDRALFSKDVLGDRTIDFFPDFVRKSVKNFERSCGVVNTTVDAVRKAYKVAAGCPYLPQLRSDKLKRSGTYVVVYGPVGYSVTLRSEQDVRNVAGCVCEALRVLHTNGLVHRDIRLENIVQISQHQFVLIDLEAAAECPNEVREFALRDWSRDTLDVGVYTKMSDMYQLGVLLVSMREHINTSNAKRFIQQLLSKNLSAEEALNDIWLLDPTQ